MKKIKVYCFPFAGGSKYSYNSFTKFLPPYLDLVTLEFPGRGQRIGESLRTTMGELVNDAFDQIIKCDLTLPYVIYGHSMGTVVGYLVTKKIIENNLSAPLALFVTGAAAPSARINEPLRYCMPKDEFIANLKKLGGSPEEILNDPEIMDFYEPILRADFQAIEQYQYSETQPFNIPIYVLTGKDEEVTFDQASTWKQETASDFDFIQFPGKHFFILDHEKQVVEFIDDKISKLCQTII